MPDTRALREDEREALRRVYEQQFGERWHKRPVLDLAYKQELAETIFTAGLRYRDGAEPSEAKVEAASKALEQFIEPNDDAAAVNLAATMQEAARAALEASRKASP